jgi:hypothetical protein
MMDAPATGNFRLFRYCIQKGGDPKNWYVMRYSLWGPSILIALYAGLLIYTNTWKDRLQFLVALAQSRIYKKIGEGYQFIEKIIARVRGIF